MIPATLRYYHFVYLLSAILLGVLKADAQQRLKILVVDAQTKQPLPGVAVKIANPAASYLSSQEGIVLLAGLVPKSYQIEFKLLGYQIRMDTLDLSTIQQDLIEILMQAEEEELEEIIVTTTRSSRSIENSPTRTEAIAGEELQEKGNMKPGDIRMLLNESTGIQTQQTSATTNNSSIRIQGLDGKYTQLLRDGMPLYAGFSGGLGLLQIAPLDLKQVEVIKGASSTLYGGGAIAGLVNMISKIPTEEKEWSFMLNGTSALGLDASTFYSQKFKNLGATVFASFNTASPYDPAALGLTAIPKFQRYTFHPKLFFDLNDKTTITAGVNAMMEHREGGSMALIKNGNVSNNPYFEENQTYRYSTQFLLNHQRNEHAKWQLKNSLSYYDRAIKLPNYEFGGLQVSSFTEVNYQSNQKKSDWIAGLNVFTDAFQQDLGNSNNEIDEGQVSIGLFGQNTYSFSDQWVLESGLRTDYHDKEGLFVLPRASLLYKPAIKLAFRLGGGLGYKTPSVFTEDAERIQFRNILPIASGLKAERSIGYNFDVNYKTTIADKLFFSINNLLFNTRVNNPLVLGINSNNFYEFSQPAGFISTKGLESNVKLSYLDFKLFVGYTYADVKQYRDGIRSTFPLVAKHRLNNVLMYELEEKLKIGLEAYYFSEQQLNDGSTGKPYWICGLMAEKLWEGWSVFINFENFLDTRQSRFDTIYTGSISNPTFRDIYAPVDGFVVNGGLKMNLFK